MSYQTDDGKHEGWDAAEFPDGRLSVGTSGGSGAVARFLEYGPDDPETQRGVVDGRTAIGWRGVCTCGWRGPLWERVSDAGDYNAAAHRIYDPDPSIYGDAPASVEDAIRGEWLGHVGRQEPAAEHRLPERALTPARLRELASQAEALAELLDTARDDFRASDDPVRRAGFRLSEAGGQAREIAREMHATAADLARIAARPDDSCGIPWGVCPEHGNTLTSSGGKTWCQITGCGREWSYDRLTMPCAEPATWRVTDLGAAEAVMCDGHASDARQNLEGARLVPVTP